MKKKQSRAPRRSVQEINRKCAFCEEKKVPNYEDVEVLRRYMSERGKILARARTGNCALHQRRLTVSIKHARHLALLPFIGQR